MPKNLKKLAKTNSNVSDWMLDTRDAQEIIDNFDELEDGNRDRR